MVLKKKKKTRALRVNDETNITTEKVFKRIVF